MARANDRRAVLWLMLNSVVVFFRDQAMLTSCSVEPGLSSIRATAFPNTSHPCPVQYFPSPEALTTRYLTCIKRSAVRESLEA
jgi:hypothetical protein